MYFAVNTQILTSSRTIQYMTTLAEKIKATRLALNMSQVELARKAGVTQGTIGHLETGRSTATTKLPAIAKALGVNVEVLLAGASDYQPSFAHVMKQGSPGNLTTVEAYTPAPDGELLDLFDYEFSAEDGHIQWRIIRNDVLTVSKKFFEQTGTRRADCKAMSNGDDSMDPFLFNRDLYVVDTARNQPREGKVYAVQFEDEPLIRQIFKVAGGGLVLHAYNPNYPDKPVGPEHLDRLVVIGQCIYRGPSSLGL